MIDPGSLVVIIGVIVLVFGISLMRKGSRGADREPPEQGDEDDELGPFPE